MIIIVGGKQMKSSIRKCLSIFIIASVFASMSGFVYADETDESTPEDSVGDHR